MYTSRAEQQIIENRRGEKKMNSTFLYHGWFHEMMFRHIATATLKAIFFLLLQPRKYLRFLTTVSYHFTVCNLFHFSDSAVTPVIFR